MICHKNWESLDTVFGQDLFKYGEEQTNMGMGGKKSYFDLMQNFFKKLGITENMLEKWEVEQDIQILE